MKTVCDAPEKEEAASKVAADREVMHLAKRIWKTVRKYLHRHINLLMALLAVLTYASLNYTVADYQGQGFWNIAAKLFAAFLALVIILEPILRLMKFLFGLINPDKRERLLAFASAVMQSAKMNLQSLVYAFQRHTKRRRLLLGCVAGGLLSIVLLCVIYYWHDASYYYHITEMYSVPVGVGEEISAKERIYASNYWRIRDYSFRKTIVMDYISQDGPVELMKEYSSVYMLRFFDTPARIEYRYAKDRERFLKAPVDVFKRAGENRYRVARSIRYYNSFGKLLLFMKIDANDNCEIMEYSQADKPGLLQSTLLKVPDGIELERCPITQMHIGYNELGLIESRIIMPLSSNSAYNLFGISGERYTYDSQNRMIAICYLDQQGNPMTSDPGVTSIAFDYEQRGRMSGIKYYKDPLLSERIEGYCGVHYEKMIFNGDLLIRREALDRNESKTYDTNGVSVYQYEYRNNGALYMESYFNSTEDNILSNSNNSSFLTFEQEKGHWGNVVKIGMADTLNRFQPVLEAPVAVPKTQDLQLQTPDYAEEKGSYQNQDDFDKNIAVPEQRSLPVTSREYSVNYTVKKYSYIYYTINNQNKIKTKAYYGADGSLVSNELGYAVCEYEYDGHKNLYKETYFDEQKSRTNNVDGFCSSETVYDTHYTRQKIRTSYFDVSGHLVSHKVLGFAVIYYDYDYTGSNCEQVTESYKNAQNEPCARIDGRYAGSIRDYDEKGRLIKESYFDVQGNPTVHTGIGVAELYYEYSDIGHLSREWYKDTIGQLAYRSDTGCAILKREYNSYGKIVSTQYFDIHEKPIAYKGAGYSIVTNEYDEIGRCVQSTFLDVDGEPVLRRDTGYACIRYIYDEYGNIANEEYFDTVGEPILRKNGGYASVVWEYDNANLEETRYLGIDGNLINHTEYGCAIVKDQYNDKGRLITQYYYNADEVPVGYKGRGYVAMTMEYDLEGRVKARHYIGTDEKHFRREDTGYSIITYSYDAFGNVEREDYFDASYANTNSGEDDEEYEEYEDFEQYNADVKDNNDVNGDDIFKSPRHWVLHKEKGCAYVISTYEDNKWMTSKYYGTDEKLALLYKKGFAIIKNEYNEFGERIKQAYYGVDEEPVLHFETGRHSYVAKYDFKGNELKVRSYGLDGELILRSDTGYAVHQYEYDEHGNVIKGLFFDTQLRPTEFTERGYASFEDIYANGNLVESKFYDVAENLTTRSDTGCAVIQSEYDNSGFVVKQRYLDAEEKLTIHKKLGYAYCISVYKHGNWMEDAYYDTGKKLTIHKEYGYAIVKNQYDTKGRIIHQAYYGIDREPVPHKERGYASYDALYDERGNVIRNRYYDKGGDLTLRRDIGVAITQFEYNEFGESIKGRYFDTEGKPILRSDYGYHMFTSIYENGHWMERKYYDRNEKLTIVQQYGYAIIRSNYENGNCIWQAYYGPKEEAAFSKDGNFASIAIKHDVHGNAIEYRYYGLDGDYVLRSDTGCAVLKYEYNLMGQVFIKEYLNDYQSPALLKDEGYYYYANQYEGSKWMGRTYYDTSYQPVLNRKLGYATIQNEYDEKGRRIRESYFGADGAPASVPDGGYVAQEWSHDVKDNVTENRYYGSQNKLMLRHDVRYAIRKVAYDDKGRMESEAFYDTNGKRIERKNSDGERIYAKKEIKYDSKGNEIEIRYYDVYDNLRQDDFVHAIEKYTYDEFGNIVQCEYLNQYEFGTNQSGSWYAGYADTYLDGKWIERKYLNRFGGLIEEEYNDYAIYKRAYNKRGLLEREAYYNHEGKPATNWEEGYSARTVQYDENGNGIEYRYYDTAGNLTLLPERGYAIVKYVYDRLGNTIQRQLFGAEEQPVLHEVDGCHSYTTVYEKGRWMEQQYRGINSELIIHTENHYAIVRNQYDDRGRLTQKSFYGADEQRINLPDTGYAFVEYTYFTEGGMEVERGRFFDWNEKATLRKDRGYAAYQDYYKDGKLVMASTYGLDGKLANRTDQGYAMIKCEYDAYGNTIYEAYYGSDRNPINRSDRGFASFTDRFENGKWVEGRTFGSDGSLICSSDGYAIYKSRFDARGNWLGEAFYNEADQLVIDPNSGYAIYEQDFNHADQITAIRYYGSDHKWMMHPAYDYAVVVYRYDKDGRQIETKRFDADLNLIYHDKYPEETEPEEYDGYDEYKPEAVTVEPPDEIHIYNWQDDEYED